MSLAPFLKCCWGPRARLLLLVAGAVVPFAAFIAYQIGEIRERRASEALQTAYQFAQIGADSYKDIIAEARTVLELIARLPEATEGTADVCHQALASVERARLWASGMWVVGENGRVRCTTIAHGVGLDLSGRPEYERAVAADGFSVSDFFVTKLRKTPSAIAALPVRSKETGERLLLAVTLELGWFDRLAANIGERAGANIVLFDSTGTLVSRYPHEQGMTGKTFAHLPAVQRILQTPSGQLEGERLDGQRAYWGYVTLPQTNLRLAVNFERAKVLANVNRGTRHAVAMSALVALLISGVIWFAGTRFFTNPMRELDELLQATLDNMDQGLIVVDRHGTLPICNRRAIELLDLPPAFMRARPAADAVLALQESRGEFENLSEELRARVYPRLHGEVHNVYERQRPNGTILEVRTTPFAAGGVVRTYTDVTERKRAEQRLQQTKAFLDTVVENIPLPVVVKDPKSLEFVLVNRAYEKFVGLPREHMLGKTIQAILPAESAEIVRRYDKEALDSGQQVVVAEFEVTTPSNRVRFLNTTRLVVNNSAGKAEHLISVLDDISARREAEQQMRHMAKHDSLTDLPNRLLLRERLENGLLGIDRGHRSLAILMIDLDRFKEINDTLGHHAGDELLKVVAARLRSCVRETATVARLGGDEFAVIDSVVDAVAETSVLAERILSALSAPIDLGDHRVTSAGSIGIAVAPVDGNDPDQLLKKADLALYRAKSERRGTFKFYEVEMDRSVQVRRTLERDLHDALTNGEFVLYYQPVVRLQDGEVSGCEALLRWSHPERGLVLPGEFLALAEETGLIGPIGEWVLRTACAEAATWPAHLRIAVNLSPAQFKGDHLASTVVTALAASGLAPKRLELEVTESLMMQDREAAIARLHQLHALGVRIALDDFGTGYSSLSFLRQFPFDNIKIGRSFVNELADTREGSRAIVRSVIGLANSLCKTTTAEGVESREMCELVLAAGCTEMQGYYFSKAITSSEIVGLLQSKPALSATAA